MGLAFMYLFAKLVLLAKFHALFKMYIRNTDPYESGLCLKTPVTIHYSTPPTLFIYVSMFNFENH